MRWLDNNYSKLRDQRGSIFSGPIFTWLGNKYQNKTLQVIERYDARMTLFRHYTRGMGITEDTPSRTSGN